MKKRVVKLNESELKDLIKESIKLTLDEESMNEYNLKDFGKDAAGVLGGAALTAGALAGNAYFSDDDPINPEQEEMNQAVEDEFGSVQGNLPSDTISWDEAMRLKKENRHMNNKLIRLTESDLHGIVKESVKRALNEGIEDKLHGISKYLVGLNEKEAIRAAYSIMLTLGSSNPTPERLLRYLQKDFNA